MAKGENLAEETEQAVSKTLRGGDRPIKRGGGGVNMNLSEILGSLKRDY